MKTEITICDGRVTVVDSEDEAREILRAEFPHAYFLDEYQPVNSRHERMLVWASEDESKNDDGANAVASIRREKTPHGNVHCE